MKKYFFVLGLLFFAACLCLNEIGMAAEPYTTGKNTKNIGFDKATSQAKYTNNTSSNNYVKGNGLIGRQDTKTTYKQSKQTKTSTTDTNQENPSNNQVESIPYNIHFINERCYWNGTKWVCRHESTIIFK